MTAHASILPRFEGRADAGRWVLAALIVLAAHGGLAAGFMLYPATPPEGAPLAPAVIIELAAMPVAPQSEADLAPGPEMVESQPTPPPEPSPPAEPEPSEPLPRSEAPAEVTLPLPEPKSVEQPPPERPVEKREAKKPEPVQEHAPPAPRTTASPRSRQQTAPVARAPSPGSAASRAAIARWRDLVVARLQRSKRYPSAAQARRVQGVATLSFSVNRHGRVMSRRIARSSGNAALDQEVMAMIQRAQPLPAFPPAMPQSVVHLTVPIRFSLR